MSNTETGPELGVIDCSVGPKPPRHRAYVVDRESPSQQKTTITNGGRFRGPQQQEEPTIDRASDNKDTVRLVGSRRASTVMEALVRKMNAFNGWILVILG